MFSIIKRITIASITVGLFLGLPLLAAAEESADLVAATQWIDRAVFSENGAEFGEIDDLVIKRSGKVKRVTIEVGGFLDLGDKMVAVSLNELKSLMMDGDSKMVLDTTEEKMKKKSEYNYYRQGLRPEYYYSHAFTEDMAITISHRPMSGPCLTDRPRLIGKASLIQTMNRLTGSFLRHVIRLLPSSTVRCSTKAVIISDESLIC